MQTRLDRSFLETPAGRVADRILRSCVHCGFCTAVCPTYQLRGDELDSPRGRIYLIKQALEGHAVTGRTRRHLDRCLGCRACETACPSNVEYARLLDIGRQRVENAAPRPVNKRLQRWLYNALLPYEARVAALLDIARRLGPLLPPSLRRRLPPRQHLGEALGPIPASARRRMLLARGCVQAAATPNTNAAAKRVLRRLGIQAHEAAGAGCCGALSHHLGFHEHARRFMTANIDAWWPLIEAGAEALVVTASGCGAMIADYGYLLRGDPAYAHKAARVSALARDLSVVLAGEEPLHLPSGRNARKVALQLPCSLKHGLKLGGEIENLLTAAGHRLSAVDDGHRCCGSAGTYSLLQPGLSGELLREKIRALTEDAPDLIATANVGCQLHIGAATALPVVHWIELLD